MSIDWFPAAREGGVVGRFEYLDLLDVPASRAADEERTKRIVVLREKVAASTDDTVRKVRPENQAALIARFPDAWKAFQGEPPDVAGTPLSAIGVPEARTLEFRLHAVTTLEQLAALTDAQCQAIGFGTRKLRDEAKAYLAKAAPAAPAAASGTARPDGPTAESSLPGTAPALPSTRGRKVR